MRITASKPIPSNEELIKVLNDEFPDNCTFREFGVGERKSIMVRKSAFVGAQISIHGNHITIQATAPSTKTSLFIQTLGIGIVEIGIFLIPFLLTLKPKQAKLEKEVAVFLNRKYA